MANSSKLWTRVRLRLPFWLEMAALGLLGVFAIVNGLNHLTLNQDSATYIVVAVNLLKSGHFYFYVSATNFVNKPGLIPYLDQPPGFPLLLVPFLVVFRDPMVSAVIAQSVYIVFFYIAIYLLACRLAFSPLLRIVTLILFTFLAPFLQIRSHYLTETLFIALSIAAGYLAIGLLTKPARTRDWILFLLVVAFSSMVRYVGVANLAWVAPLVLKKDVLRTAWHLFTHKYFFVCVSIGGGLLIALSLLADFLPNAKPGIGPMQRRGILLGGAAVIIGLAGLAFWRYRLSKHYPEGHLLKPDSIQIDSSTWALASIFAALVPTLAWLARNKLFFNDINNWLNPSKGLFPGITYTQAAVPFQYIWNELLDFRIVPRLLAALLVIGLLILPFFRLPVFGMAGSRKVAQTVILWEAGTAFAVLYLTSFVTTHEAIDARYFSPILAFLLMGILNGLQQVSEFVRPRLWSQVLLAVPVVFLVLNKGFSLTDLSLTVGKINYPLERQLWSEIDKIPWTHSSSFFYTDEGYYAGGYVHEIFSGRPQGILWDRSVVKDPKKIKSLLSAGVRPFLLVTENGPDARIFDGMISSGRVPLERIPFPDAGFVLYDLGK